MFLFLTISKWIVVFTVQAVQGDDRLWTHIRLLGGDDLQA